MKKCKINKFLFLFLLYTLFSLFSTLLLAQEKPPAPVPVPSMEDRDSLTSLTRASVEGTDWTKERAVKTIQKRIFEKDGRHEFTIYSGIVPNDEFFLYFPAGLRWAYYLSESTGFEISSAYTFNIKTDLKRDIEAEKFFSSVETPEELIMYAGISGIWAPIYGKIEMFGKTLIHFDLALFFGAGYIQTAIYRTNKFQGYEHKEYGNVGAGFKFFMTDRWVLRVDYRHFIYPATGSGVSYPAEITLGLSWFTSPLK